MQNYKMLIGGKWVDSSDGNKIEVMNPATEEIFATVPAATEEDINMAVTKAHDAFRKWKEKTPFERGKILRRGSKIVYNKANEIACLMTEELGKPVKEARGEVEKGAEILQYYAEEGERIYGRVIANEEKNIQSTVVYEPIGVAAGITPWNYPIELLAWKIGGALASGCSMVAKLPSETPLSPLKFSECLVEAGVPDGVLNAITGKGESVGPELIKNPLVKRVAFTGSTETGKMVLKMCAESGIKKVTAELGGSLPMIISKDANLDAAVEGAIRRSFRNAGQICIAINRIYVEKEIYKDFIEKFAEKAREIKVGNSLIDNSIDMGPMCTENGMKKVEVHIQDALAKGAKLAYGGKRLKGSKFEKGFFFEPTILYDVNHDMLIMREETFGPAVGVMPFNNIDDAIMLANDTPYGLAAIVYTNNLNILTRCAREIEAGNIAINNVDAGVINAPYGGWKDSGLGVEHGPEGLREYLIQKHIRIRYHA